MTIKVNGVEAPPGCYIAGHHGQYALDELGGLAEQFDIELDDDDDPRFWRAAAEAETSKEAVVISNGPGRIGSHLATPEECMERQVWAADKVEELLNEQTTGGYWTWLDGEFYLVQTEVERTIFVLGDDYDHAWERLCEGKDIYGGRPLGATKANVFGFTARISYEPESWSDATAYELIMGHDN